MARYVTDVIGVLGGSIIGAATGATATTTAYILPGTWSLPITALPEITGVALFFLLVAFVFWVAGFAAFGLPVWLVAHHLCWRSAGHAILCGIVLAGGGSLFILASGSNLIPLWPALQRDNNLGFGVEPWTLSPAILNTSLVIGCAGAIAGWMTWRIAYRRGWEEGDAGPEQRT